MMLYPAMSETAGASAQPVQTGERWWQPGPENRGQSRSVRTSMLEDKPVSIAIREIAAGHLDDLEEEPAAEAEETLWTPNRRPPRPGGRGPPGGRNRGSLICSHDRGQDCPLGGHLCH